MSSRSSFAAVAVAGAACSWRLRRLWLALFAVDLVVAAAVAQLVLEPATGALAGRPAPELLQWTALWYQHGPRLLTRLAWLGAALALYRLAAPLAVAATLGQAQAGSWWRGVRSSGPRLLLLRLLVGAAQLLLVAGCYLAALQLYRWSAAWVDERALVAAVGGAALLFAVPLALLALLEHYAQPLVFAGASPPRALDGALRGLHRAPLLLTTLWAAGRAAHWLLASAAVAVAVVAADRPLLVLVAGQLAALLKVGVAIWGWAAADECATASRA